MRQEFGHILTLECSPPWISIPSSCCTSLRSAGFLVFRSLAFPAQVCVSRVSGRVFMGTSLCELRFPLHYTSCWLPSLGHNEEYLNLSVDNTITIMRTKDTLSYFPKILNPCVVSKYVDKHQSNSCRTVSLLCSLTKEDAEYNTVRNLWSPSYRSVLMIWKPLAMIGSTGR